jgi:Lignostilbene-alpha,beta-dioxygenase and related enzymes
MDAHSGFHSLHEETATSLPVTGTLPEWLRGSLVRNGPGAFSFPSGGSVDHWFDGLAMVYRFTFDPAGSGSGTDTVHYRNRFLRTDAYDEATSGRFDGGFATGETTLRSRLAGFLTAPYDNTNIIAERIGDAYLALTESPRKVQFDPNTLETTGHVEYETTCRPASFRVPTSSATRRRAPSSTSTRRSGALTSTTCTRGRRTATGDTSGASRPTSRRICTASRSRPGTSF